MGQKISHIHNKNKEKYTIHYESDYTENDIVMSPHHYNPNICITNHHQKCSMCKQCNMDYENLTYNCQRCNGFICSACYLDIIDMDDYALRGIICISCRKFIIETYAKLIKKISDLETDKKIKNEIDDMVIDLIIKL